MKVLFLSLVILSTIIACNSSNSESATISLSEMKQQLKNEKIHSYKFLSGMYSDTYFPKQQVAKVEFILVDFCQQIEQYNPKTLKDLYVFSHAATNKINDLQNEFAANGSEIETAAREVIAMDFEFIAKSYGYEKADIESLIATRDW